MNVLGVSPLDKDATVTIVQDGKVTYAAGEERFTRRKLQDGFPHHALADGLRRTGLRPAELDRVVYPFLPWEREQTLFDNNIAEERRFLRRSRHYRSRALLSAVSRGARTQTEPIPGLSAPGERRSKPPWKLLGYKLLGAESPLSRLVANHESSTWARNAATAHRQWHADLESSLAEMGLLEKLSRVDHHASHAANAYYTSGFEEALVVTLDGYGSGLAGTISVARHGSIKRLHGIPFPHSLGTLYETVTSALGFVAGRHEGKVVGLAAYGDPSVLGQVLLSRIEQEPGAFRIVESNNPYFARLLAATFPKIDVAAAYQYVLEAVATRYVSHYVGQTGLRNLVLSGGVVANVKLNQRLKALAGIDQVFVHPHMGDGGCGTGAALMAFDGPSVCAPLNDVYWGPGYTDDEIESAVQRAQLTYTRHAPIESEIARLIADGRVVARFDGRMEYGPRALGNRSILYHAKEPAVNQWLNQRLGRTEFMPFAPVTLAEDRHAYYKEVDGAEYAAQFMTITFDCTERMKRESPAAVHVDGTARPQLVTERSNPSLYRVLQEYRSLTGLSCLINTSFNMHEEPIVCSPEDAIRAFLQGNLDYLAIGSLLVPHPTTR